jgi:phage FluMu protein Com
MATVGLLHDLIARWETRNLELSCPRCKTPASPRTFGRGRYMRGDATLVCEHCNQASLVTFWRFEGFSKISRLECTDFGPIGDDKRL